MSDSDKIKAELKYLESIADLRASKIGSTASYLTDAIDTKTQALLTHVSIMMAILSIFYSGLGANSWLRLAILIELLAYLIVTLGCLRAIFIIAPSVLDTTPDVSLEKRLKLTADRRKAYRISLYSTIAVTIAFIVTVGIHAVSLSI